MGRPRNLRSVRVGAPGSTVTAYERRAGGALYLRWWMPATDVAPGRWAKRALRHNDQGAAEQAAREIAASLLASTLAASSGKATVAEVLAAYERDRCRHQKGDGPKESDRRVALWTHVLGATRDVETVDFPTLDAFARDRRAGTIALADHKLRKVSSRGVAADLEFLRAALNHACTVVRPTGGRLLKVNPVAGYEIPRNKRPRRPIVSYDRFLAVMEHADAADPHQRLFGGFMTLVEGLGWRVSAICGLRASDVDLRATAAAPHGRIFKRAETDKEGVSGWVPMSVAVRAGVDRIRVVNPAIGEWPLFPAPRATTELPNGTMPKPWTRYYARALLERAESLAKLPSVEGGDFHPYRRKWATERKHLPDQDVAASGGWSGTRALKQSYQQVDEQTMFAVVSEPTKLRDVPASKAETA